MDTSHNWIHVQLFLQILNENTESIHETLEVTIFMMSFPKEAKIYILVYQLVL